MVTDVRVESRGQPAGDTKQLVDAMGGSIEVASELGRGATFIITMKRSAVGANVVTLAA